jgi:hypothetical protein
MSEPDFVFGSSPPNEGARFKAGLSSVREAEQLNNLLQLTVSLPELFAIGFPAHKAGRKTRCATLLYVH